MGRRSRHWKQTGLSDAGGEGADARLRNRKGLRLPSRAVLALAAAALLGITVCCVEIYQKFSKSAGTAGANDPRRAEVEELIGRYFSTWSQQDSKGYADCFLSNASVQYIDPRGNLESFTLPAFLATQDAVFKLGAKETEAPLTTDIRFEADLARVVVYWRLLAGRREVFGFDHFTLRKRGGRWGIVNLVFYETKRSG